MAVPPPDTDPVDLLKKWGITVGEKGSLIVSPEAVAAIQRDRVRRAAVGRTPSTTRWQYKDGGGVGVRKGQGRTTALSFESLRLIREKSPIIKPIHAARFAQIVRLATRWSGKLGDVGWRVVHKDHLSHRAKQPAGFERYINLFESMLEVPSPDHCPTTAQFICKIWDDFATINRPVVEKLTLGRDHVVGWRPVDGSLIWETNLLREKWIQDNPNIVNTPVFGVLTDAEQLEFISSMLDQDITTARYCCVRDGILENVYRPGQLLVGSLDTRTDITWNGYSPGKVEDAVETALGFLNAFDYNGNFFTQGLINEIIIGITGNVHDTDIDAFVDQLRESSQGVGHAHRPPVMPLPEGGSIEVIKIKENNKDMGFEGWISLLLSLTCANYRIDPSTVNAKPWDGGSSGGLAQPSRGKEISLAKEEGLQADMMHIGSALLDPLARSVHPDLRVLMEYGDFDPQKEAAVYEIQARVCMTRNEVRLAQGMTPMGFWLPEEEYVKLGDDDEKKKKYDKNIWNMPTDAAFVSQRIQQIQQEEAALQQQAPPPQPDGFGGERGPDDGFGEPKQAAPFGQPDDQQAGSQGGAPPPPQQQPDQQGAPLRKARETVFIVRQTGD
jgi:hypothetical protein